MITTPIAQVVDWKHSTDAKGNLYFDLKLLAVHPELMEAYFKLRQGYEEVASKSENNRTAELEAKHDELVMAYRRLKSAHSDLANESFSLRQRATETANVVGRAFTAVNNQRWVMESESGEFLTKVEKENQQFQMEKLKKVCDAAEMADSKVAADFQRMEYSKSEAGIKVNEAAVAVADCKRELDAFQGKKGGYSPTTGLSMV